jgi:ribosomal protein S27AE
MTMPVRKPDALANRQFVQRECPICGHTQFVSPGRFHDALICEKCDYLIPAKKKAA